MDGYLTYILNESAGSQSLTLKNETFKYLIKVRRHKVDDLISFRNPNENRIEYKYILKSIDGRSCSLELLSSNKNIVEAVKKLHIGWCVIDIKSIEKVLPSLNEIGVNKITFIECSRSQKSFKLDFDRFNRMLTTSSQQCGRSSTIEFAQSSSIKKFILNEPKTTVFDFSNQVLSSEQVSKIETILVGCEGGFSEEERELLKANDVIKLNTPMILRSESAVMVIASKILC
ncbi:MAG: 16S rRNA (uracil(1498)-N(3))-methyltransferase [Helicobacteraceae bacterium]|nr:16S rRNA (uracil(1498)-N(3))-methyltransferase [Helicobacteraceae bacterium]